ncbi:MAG: hypothetical protein CM1200mP16_05930 [Nitrospina sp.]|nr:MAG: hypothetical protein CM1200mP16_05930 [Nitrospina sp.]
MTENIPIDLEQLILKNIEKGVMVPVFPWKIVSLVTKMFQNYPTWKYYPKYIS